MQKKFEFTWMDMYRMSQCQRNRIKPATIENIKEEILTYLEVKYCCQCEHSKHCHDEAVKCDDMFTLLEGIGFEL